MSSGMVVSGGGFVAFEQDLMAKKNPRMAKSVDAAAGLSRVSSNSRPADVHMARNNLGVIARCRLGAGSALEKALKRALVAGRNWADPGRCTGLGSRLSLNALAKWPAASRTVLATIGFLRVPSIDPLPLFHCLVRRQVMKDLTKSSRPIGDNLVRKGSEPFPASLQNPIQRLQVRWWDSLLLSTLLSKTRQRFAVQTRPKRKSRWVVERS